MNDASANADVNQPVQHIPTPPAEPPDHSAGGSYCERNHEHECCEAHGDERTFVNVIDHRVNIKTRIDPDPGRKVQAGVEKGEKAEHAPEANQPVLLQDSAQRSHRESYAETDERPCSGGMGDVFDRVRAELVVEAHPSEMREWQETRHENRRLEPPHVYVPRKIFHVGAEAEGAFSNSFAGPCRCTSLQPGRRNR